MTTNDMLRVTDSRTGRSYELPIVDGAIRAIDLRQIKTSDDDFGLLSYDPAFQNTASCRSAITFIDGDKGILRYRGYPIDELASRASFLDVAWLLLRGEIPDKDESAGWVHQISHHTFVHENIKKFIDGFHHDAHPMGILVSTLAGLSTFYPEASNIRDPACREQQVVRLIAKMPTLAAFAYRHARGLPYAYPDDDLSYTGNFLNMMAKMTEPKYEPNPILEHALDVLFILHADHEQNCSTNAMRSVSSSQVDPYSAAAAAAAALYGPLHGGANEQVLKMLREIGSVANVPAYVARARTSTSTRASSTRRWASRWPCSRCCSRSAGCPAGWLTGRRAPPTRSRRSRGRGRSTWARPSATSTARPGRTAKAGRAPDHRRLARAAGQDAVRAGQPALRRVLRR